MPSKKTAPKAHRRRSEYTRNVFINCPFDDEYTPIFEAIVFTIQACGFRPICARSRLNSSDVRLQKIVDLIARCRYSIHDLSRTELDRVSTLPRFNMPLELGIDIGCRVFGADQSDKSFLIFDRDRFRFQTYVSDIAGQDIADHGNDPNMAIARARDWLRTEAKRTHIPGAKAMQSKYVDFRRALPALCERFELDISALTFDDLVFVVGAWLTPPTPVSP
ncbi:MAG: hypothetical protein JO093_19460 [Acidobacteria bacterium]|nr:hypothetical protein [Acidobacteriota bacterium]MBV9071550.1 hypothetical protein [Acidobacteriota bacterium]MBV9187803.1 hypothetical protein [Acidobacteriota bacterium]